MWYSLPEIRRFPDKGEKLITSFAILFSLLFSLTAYGSQDSEHLITVHYPSERTVNEYGLMGMSISVPDGTADQIKVNIHNKEKLIKVSDGKYICFTVEMKLGVNIIELEAMK